MLGWVRVCPNAWRIQLMEFPTVRPGNFRRIGVTIGTPWEECSCFQDMQRSCFLPFFLICLGSHWRRMVVPTEQLTRQTARPRLRRWSWTEMFFSQCGELALI